MNRRYQDLKVTEGTYVPPERMDYSEDDPYVGLYKPVYDRDYPEIDANYPYVNDRFSNRFCIFMGTCVILPLVGLILRLTYGLRWQIEGEQRWHWCTWSSKRVLRQHDLSNGAITIANHCFRHDCASVLTALGRACCMDIRVPMFAPNFRTKDQYFLRSVGGIPIPAAEAGLSAMKAFNAAFDEFNRRKYWFHIFPETKRWDFYKPLRPFQKGAFTMAYKYNKPIIPCAVTYRERTGIWRWLGAKDEPLIQVIIGTPIYPDTKQPRAAETERLLNITHQTICRLAGIKHNTWPSQL